MASIALGLGLGALGSLGGAALESNAAGNAASTQAGAAEYNEQLQAELGQEQLGYESQQYGNTLNMEMPWLQSGANNLATLNYLMGQGNQNGSGVSATGSPVKTPGATPQSQPQSGALPGVSSGTNLSIPGLSGSVNVPSVGPIQGTANTNIGTFGQLMQSYPGGTFQAPTLQQAEQQPGYQFTLQQGENALQAGAAANGSLLTGGTMNALDQYAQGLATTNYNNVYNQALQSYDTNYNTWSNNQANLYNRLASMAGMGQTTAQQLSNAGLTSAGQVGSTLGTTGTNIANQNMNAANATASGYMNSANAWAGGMQGASGGLSQLLMLQQLMGGGANSGVSNSTGDEGGY